MAAGLAVAAFATGFWTIHHASCVMRLSHNVTCPCHSEHIYLTNCERQVSCPGSPGALYTFYPYREYPEWPGTKTRCTMFYGPSQRQRMIGVDWGGDRCNATWTTQNQKCYTLYLYPIYACQCMRIRSGVRLSTAKACHVAHGGRELAGESAAPRAAQTVFGIWCGVRRSTLGRSEAPVPVPECQHGPECAKWPRGPIRQSKFRIQYTSTHIQTERVSTASSI
jgi:hypothetical protein